MSRWGIAEANIIFYNSPKSEIQERITFHLTKYPIKFCQGVLRLHGGGSNFRIKWADLQNPGN